jgi:hypothetical protein
MESRAEQNVEPTCRFRGRVINLQKTYGFIRNGSKFYFHSSCLKKPELFTPELLGRTVEFSSRAPDSRRKNPEAFDIDVLGSAGAGRG